MNKRDTKGKEYLCKGRSKGMKKEGEGTFRKRNEGAKEMGKGKEAITESEGKRKIVRGMK